MARLSDIVAYADEFLSACEFKDYCPNGLQVEGGAQVKKIVSGVTASQALIDGAIKKGADLILVHHGFFWRGENAVIVGLKKKRINALLKHDISLLAYHLPLDAHEECGNNVQLAKRLSLRPIGVFGESQPAIGLIAEFSQPLSSQVFAHRIESVLMRSPIHLSADSTKKIQRVAICTGGAQSYFSAAIDENVDAFVTGEVSESSYHLAMESGVDYFAAGHHATERYGVQALAELLSETFSLEHEYLEIPNPI